MSTDQEHFKYVITKDVSRVIQENIHRVNNNQPYPYFWEENAKFLITHNFHIECKPVQKTPTRTTTYINVDGNPSNIIFDLLKGSTSYGLPQDVTTQIQQGKAKLIGLLHGDPRYPLGGFHTLENRGDESNASLKTGSEEGFTIRTNLYTNLFGCVYTRFFNLRTKNYPYPHNRLISEQTNENGKYGAYLGKNEKEIESNLRKYPLMWTEEMTNFYLNGNVAILGNVQFMRDNEYKQLPPDSKLPPCDIIYGVAPLWHPSDNEKENLTLYRLLISNILFTHYKDFDGIKVLVLSGIGLNYFIKKYIKDGKEFNRIRNLCIDVIDELTRPESKTEYDFIIKVGIKKN